MVLFSWADIFWDWIKGWYSSKIVVLHPTRAPHNLNRGRSNWEGTSGTEYNTKWLAFCIFCSKLLSHPLSYLGLREVKFVPRISKKNENQCVGCQGLADSSVTLVGLSLMLKTSFPRLLCGSEDSGKDLDTAIQMHKYEIWVAETERGRLQGIHCSVSDCDKCSRILEPAVMVAISCFVKQFSSSAASCSGQGQQLPYSGCSSVFGGLPPFPPQWARVNSVGYHTKPPLIYPKLCNPNLVLFSWFYSYHKVKNNANSITGLEFGKTSWCLKTGFKWLYSGVVEMAID